MTRLRRAFRVLLLAGLLAALFAPVGASQGPFYIVPSRTHECENVPKCIGVTGPWIVVPAHGIATFLVNCPNTRTFLVGGTDALTSSSEIRVWFDGPLGSPLGTPSHLPTGRALSNAGSVLLFHAQSNDGRMGSFEPALGCIKLVQSTKRSTLSVLAPAGSSANTPSAPVDLRTKAIPLGPGARLVVKSSCLKRESLVGSWTALGFDTDGPPDLSHVNDVKIATRVANNAVGVVITTRTSLPVPPPTEVQLGAMCEP